MTTTSRQQQQTLTLIYGRQTSPSRTSEWRWRVVSSTRPWKCVRNVPQKVESRIWRTHSENDGTDLCILLFCSSSCQAHRGEFRTGLPEDPSPVSVQQQHLYHGRCVRLTSTIKTQHHKRQACTSSSLSCSAIPALWPARWRSTVSQTNSNISTSSTDKCQRFSVTGRNIRKPKHPDCNNSAPK